MRSRSLSVFFFASLMAFTHLSAQKPDSNSKPGLLHCPAVLSKVPLSTHIASCAMSYVLGPDAPEISPVLGLLAGMRTPYRLLDVKVYIAKDTSLIELTIDTILVGQVARPAGYKEKPAKGNDTLKEFTQSYQFGLHESPSRFTTIRWPDAVPIDRASVHTTYRLGLQRDTTFLWFELFGHYDSTAFKADSARPLRLEP